VGYKAPEEIVILDQMPFTATGKLDRTYLNRMAEANLTPEAPSG
jgi:acyl-CoA synthetase (AMP-forming)/AMP-acid ligase II